MKMETHSPQFMVRLGLFITASFVLFVLAIFLIGRQKHLFDPVFKLKANFKNVSGLQVGNNIRFSGINVGNVENINILNDTTIQVEMIIKKSVQQFLKTDCKATIGSEGIIGSRILMITQGSFEARTVKNGSYISSIEPVETDAIISSLSVTAENLQVISGQVAEIMYKINNGNGTLARLIEDSTISENINQMVINLKKGTKGLDENMEAAKSNFLLRGYFRKKAKEKEEKAKADTEKQNDNKEPAKKEDTNKEIKTEDKK
jgi:phospholipid/cholesterol/gamma-HCH transport system substrate-binding protein